MAASTVLPLPMVRGVSQEVWMDWIFRIGIGTCFIGHGAFGIITKEAWLPYFGLVGITPETAYTLMPLVGALDIGVGIVGLLSPRRWVLIYMMMWSVWTALLRPLTGESIWEFVERAGNYGVPLAFLVAVGFGTPRSWFERIRVVPMSMVKLRQTARVLRLTTVFLLAGHGMLAITGANGLAVLHLSAIGWSPDVALIMGGLEIGLAIAVLSGANPTFLVAVAVWKMATELLFPVAGSSWWEVVERGGSYTAPLLLALLVPLLRHGSSADVGAGWKSNFRGNHA